MDDSQLQVLLGSLQALSDRLATGGHYLDAALVSGGLQAIRALRTKLEPPAPAERAPLAVVTEG